MMANYFECYQFACTCQHNAFIWLVFNIIKLCEAFYDTGHRCRFNTQGFR